MLMKECSCGKKMVIGRQTYATDPVYLSEMHSTDECVVPMVVTSIRGSMLGQTTQMVVKRGTP